jgi:hypothetical protein
MLRNFQPEADAPLAHNKYSKISGIVDRLRNSNRLRGTVAGRAARNRIPFNVSSRATATFLRRRR